MTVAMAEPVGNFSDEESGRVEKTGVGVSGGPLRWALDGPMAPRDDSDSPAQTDSRTDGSGRSGVIIDSADDAKRENRRMVVFMMSCDEQALFCWRGVGGFMWYMWTEAASSPLTNRTMRLGNP
jgi:hypothetical protein